MNRLILAFLLFASFSIYGQIDNSFQDDKTNIYIHALDSLVKIADTEIIPNDPKNQKIYIDADRQILRYLPTHLGGHEIIRKETLNGKLKGKRRLNGLWIIINPISIYDKGTLCLRMAPYIQKRNRSKTYGIFEFHYEYFSEEETIKLYYVNRKGTFL